MTRWCWLRSGWKKELRRCISESYVLVQTTYCGLLEAITYCHLSQLPRAVKVLFPEGTVAVKQSPHSVEIPRDESAKVAHVSFIHAHHEYRIE